MDNKFFSTKINYNAPIPTVVGVSATTVTAGFGNLFKPYKINLLLGFLCLAGTNIALLLVPSLINGAVSIVETRQPFSFGWGAHHLIFSNVLSICLFMMACVVVSTFFRIFSRKLIFDIGRNIEKDLRRTLFSHLLLLSNNFYRNNQIGDIMSHVTSDISNIRMACGFSILNTLNLIIVFTGTIPIMFHIDTTVACVALAPFLCVMFGAWITSKSMFQRTHAYQESLGKLTGVTQQALGALAVVKLFQQEAKERARFAVSNELVFQTGRRLAFSRVCMFPIMRFLGGIGVAMTIYFGGLAVSAGRLSIGDFVEINARLMQLSWPAISLGFIVSSINRGQASISRINVLLATQPEVVDGPKLSLLSGQLKVRKLSLNYQGEELLHDLNFTLEPGHTLAVVGRVGSGKSLLTKALLREIPVPAGTIFFDNHDLVDLHLQSLFSQVALVSSDHLLLSLTVRENICFADPTVSQEKIQAVIKLVALDNDILTFPHGLETMVGERGITLSGGQRQRVALARALIAEPQILVMDDCLSAVDAENQALIMKRLRNYGRIRSLIIVSHRLSSITHANEIIVLDQGSIVERGNHESLLEKNGHYAALWGVEKFETGRQS